MTGVVCPPEDMGHVAEIVIRIPQVGGVNKECPEIVFQVTRIQAIFIKNDVWNIDSFHGFLLAS